MDFYCRLCDVFDCHPANLYQFCQDCDEEITGHDSVFYEPDGDIDDDGRAYDASTYLCKACGIEKGHLPI